MTTPEASHLGGSADQSEGQARSIPVDDDMLIVGRSAALLTAIEKARRLARSQLPVLIVGATGTGKELLARLVHTLSGRRGPLVAVDCGALPDELVESMLFGHRRGAYTDAVDDVEGLIEQADRGTLFLDEMGSLPFKSQSKFLRIIETGQVTRLGAPRPKRVDFRLVSTLLEDGGHPLRDGRLRADLLHRVAGAVIRLPPLAERLDDILPLARHFAAQVGCRLEAGAERALLAWPWPGNVRELRWTVECAALLATNHLVCSVDLQEALAVAPTRYLGDNVADDSPAAAELRALCYVHEGNPNTIARALGIGRATLYRRLKGAGLELRQFRGRGQS